MAQVFFKEKASEATTATKQTRKIKDSIGAAGAVETFFDHDDGEENLDLDLSDMNEDFPTDEQLAGYGYLEEDFDVPPDDFDDEDEESEKD